MKVCHYPNVDLPESARPAVTLGNFDGVHLGHRRAMELLKTRAKALAAPAVAVTFEPHPVSVVRPDQAPKRILTPELKQEVLAKLDLDYLVVIHFTKEFSRIEPQEFVKEVLVGKLHVAELVLGEKFRFGRGRAGDFDSLRALGKQHGFVVHQVEASSYGGEMISSSRIRQSLTQGRVEEAGAMLGRSYFIQGTVIAGDGRGRLMGFPTANIRVAGDLLLGDGVYVTDVVIDGERYHSMTHVGRRPTFGLDERMVETHLFDFDRQIYGLKARLYFHQRVRGTVAFDSADALKAQLEKDRQQAQAFFDGQGRNLVL